MVQVVDVKAVVVLGTGLGVVGLGVGVGVVSLVVEGVGVVGVVTLVVEETVVGLGVVGVGVGVTTTQNPDPSLVKPAMQSH